MRNSGDRASSHVAQSGGKRNDERVLMLRARKGYILMATRKRGWLLNCLLLKGKKIQMLELSLRQTWLLQKKQTRMTGKHTQFFSELPKTHPSEKDRAGKSEVPLREEVLAKIGRSSSRHCMNFHGIVIPHLQRNDKESDIKLTQV